MNVKLNDFRFDVGEAKNHNISYTKLKKKVYVFELCYHLCCELRQKQKLWIMFVDYVENKSCCE